MNIVDVMAQLEQMGTESNRRIYRNHGAHDPIAGVSSANLKLLVKANKKDHALAQALWETGHYDAQILASMIADPAQTTEALIDNWAQTLNSYILADYLADVIVKTPFAAGKAQQGMTSEHEWVGRIGWHVVAKLAADKTRPDHEFEPLLPVIERDIHTQPNRTRQAMLNALIAIGGRGGAVMEQAISAAERIGLVDIDHGQTDCKTPDAIPYMRRIVAHAEKKAAKTPAAS